MGKSEKELQKFMSYLTNLMIHVIKIVAEKRVTSSWTTSIYNSLVGMYRANKRDNNSLRFKNISELIETINEIYPIALDIPSQECFDKYYKGDIEAFSSTVDKDEVINLTTQLTSFIFSSKLISKELLVELINNFEGS